MLSAVSNFSRIASACSWLPSTTHRSGPVVARQIWRAVPRPIIVATNSVAQRTAIASTANGVDSPSTTIVTISV